jgi:NAD(P)-dependent dehydrogenase (short-subunit alcohol dehydrogenase family)
MRFPSTHWAVVLGGSSGFGLASAQKLAEHGMNCFLVHRDRRGAMSRIEPEFDRIRAHGVSLVTMNVDALDPEVRDECVGRLAEALGPDGASPGALHSIAFGNLEAPRPRASEPAPALQALANALDLDPATLSGTVNRLFGEGVDALASLADPPRVLDQRRPRRRGLRAHDPQHGDEHPHLGAGAARARPLADDARVFGLTSEGNTVAWRLRGGRGGESGARIRGARHGGGIRALRRRSNVIQAGVTDTPALRCHSRPRPPARQARLRNPFRRLTTPRDASRTCSICSTDDAVDQRGALIRRRRGARRRDRRVSYFLHGLGHHPENEITNAFLRRSTSARPRRGSRSGWASIPAGRRCRSTTSARHAKLRSARGAGGDPLHPRRVRTARAEMALARAGITAADVGMVIAGSSVMDTTTPAEACNVARRSASRRRPST